jgi:hypothetical protein
MSFVVVSFEPSNLGIGVDWSTNVPPQLTENIINLIEWLRSEEQNLVVSLKCLDTQHNDTKHKGTQHNDTQHNVTLHNITKYNVIKHNDSSSRGKSPSALHSYSKRRFIRPFASPCSLFTFSSVVVSWREPGGQWEGESWEPGESWLEKAGRPERAEGSLDGKNFLIIVLYK